MYKPTCPLCKKKMSMDCFITLAVVSALLIVLGENVWKWLV